MSPLCQHCHRCKACRPRGLCWSCYYRPGVRDLYPSTSKYAYRGVGNITGVQPLPCEPTTTEPGSEERLRVLEERARLKQSLFHPDDVRFIRESPPLVLRPLRSVFHSAGGPAEPNSEVLTSVSDKES